MLVLYTLKLIFYFIKHEKIKDFYGNEEWRKSLLFFLIKIDEYDGEQATTTKILEYLFMIKYIYIVTNSSISSFVFLSIFKLE